MTDEESPDALAAGSEVDASGSVAGFVCGVIGLSISGLLFPVSIALGIVGWIFSAAAIKRMPSGRSGRGLAVAGLVLSIAALIAAVVVAVRTVRW